MTSSAGAVLSASGGADQLRCMTSSDAVINGDIRKELCECFKWSLPKPLSVPVNEKRRSPSFQFSGRSWFLTVCPKYSFKGQMFTSLYLEIEKCDPEDTVTVTFIIILENNDDVGKKFPRFTFNARNSYGGWPTFSKNNGIGKGKSSHSWTITCYIMSAELEEEPEEPVLFKKFNTLSTNFKELFVNGEHSDVTIKVKDSAFQAHKAILAARSPALAAAFQHDMLEKQTGVITVEDCCPNSFKHFLEYLYSGTIDNYSWSTIYHLYIIADKYNEKDLKSFCLSHLMLNLTVQNVSDVVRLADQYDEARLMDSAHSFFVQNFNQIVFASEWEKLLKDNFRLANKLMQHLASSGDQNKIKNDEPGEHGDSEDYSDS